MFYNDIQKIIVLKSDYKPKIFATYLNMVGYIYYTVSNFPLSYISIDTIAKNTGINRKSVVEYLKALHEADILHFHFHINDSTTKNYCTRSIHKDYTAKWAVGAAEVHYKTDRSKFKGAGFGVAEE